MNHGTDKTQSSIPEWAKVCPPNAGAAPARAAPVELTAGRAAMSNVSEQPVVAQLIVKASTEVQSQRLSLHLQFKKETKKRPCSAKN
jgi:hypothetical protein